MHLLLQFKLLKYGAKKSLRKCADAGAEAEAVAEAEAEAEVEAEAEAAPVQEGADETLSEEASGQLKAAAAAIAAADKSHSSEQLPGPPSEELPGPPNEGEDATAVKTVATKEVVAAAGAVVAEDEEAMDKKKKIAATIFAPLAEKITEYILDHQDEAAQEDRWRTTIKREMKESFRVQRGAINKQREASDSRFDMLREAIDSRFDMQREAIDKLVKNFANVNQG